MAEVGNASLNLERGPAPITGQKSEARDYDPLWSNALALLDYLESNDLIQRSPISARIGQFVLATGSMTIMDLTLFKGLWSLPAVKQAVARSQQSGSSPSSSLPTQNRQQRRADRSQSPQNSVAQSGSDVLTDSMLSLVEMLPHALQVRITLNESKAVVWASLGNDAMVVSGADLLLKHGVSIAGEWTMIGVLDAFPDADETGNLTEDGIAGAMSALSLSDNPFGQLMFQMMPHIRPLLGRPFSAFGVTPLVIFREVAG